MGKKHNEHLTAQTKRLQDQLDEEERLRNEQHEREKDQGSVPKCLKKLLCFILKSCEMKIGLFFRMVHRKCWA